MFSITYANELHRPSDDSFNFFASLLQTMLLALEPMTAKFAKSLHRNLCLRILERRTVASRLSRFVRNRGNEDIKLDRTLAAVRESVITTGNEASYNSFADFGDIREEIARLETGKRQKQGRAARDGPRDDYEAFLEDDEVDERVSSSPAKPSTEELLELLSKGYNVLPDVLTTTLSTIQPTSVPSERLFSRARHARRYCQERALDDRFANDMRLKEFYRKSKPYEKFVEENNIPFPEAETS